MATSEDGIAAISIREGRRHMMYRDSAGLPTIGVGHLLTRDELRSGKIAGVGPWAGGLTDEQVDLILRRDLAVAEDAVERYVTVPLTVNQYDALVSFVFNVGVGSPDTATGAGTGFQGSTLLTILNSGNYAGVPAQLRRWIHSGGKIDPGLAVRREREVDQWLGEPIR